MNELRLSTMAATRPAPAAAAPHPPQPRPEPATPATGARTPCAAAVLGLLLAPAAVPGHAQAPPPPADPPIASRQAHDRHREAVSACRQAADPAACNRAADADLAADLREANRLRPPGAATGEQQRDQQRQLLRELEQAAPRPLPRQTPD